MPMPIAIFIGVEGSLPRLRSQANTAMMTGVRNTTQKGLADWKISAVMGMPKISRRV